MKKIFKLFLCLLMLFSFSNITILLAEREGESEFVSAKDVADHYSETGFMRLLLSESGEDANLTVNVDEANHKINLITDDEVFFTYGYNDEYIFYKGTAPESEDDIDLGKVFGEMIYTENLLYAVLDVMGYETKDVEIADDVDPNEDFFNEYGLYMKEGEYSFGEEGSEEGHVSGTYIDEIRISLNKEKIAALVSDYGIDRIDYEAVLNGEVYKPEVTVKKKSTYINLTWEEVYNATKYEIYRSEKKDGKYSKIATVTTSSYKDKKVTYGKTYYYKVKAIGKKNKKTSDIVSLKLVPAQVKDVTLTSIKNNSIKINYGKQPETGYVIYRSTDNKRFDAVKTITKNSTLSYTNSGLKANKTYYYKVRAYKQVGKKKVYGKYSEVVSAKTAPANPTLSVKVNTYDSLKLTTTTVKGATKYLLYRSTKKDGTYEKIGEVEPTFVNDGLTYGKTYYYKVKACNAENKCSGYSKVVSAKVSLKKPSVKLTTSKTSPLQVKVSGLTAVEGYVLYKSTDGKKWTKLATLDSGVSVYEDSAVKKDKKYYYRVKTFVTIKGTKTYSAYSDAKSIKNLYSKPKEEVVTTKEALSVLEFVGKYKKGSNLLKIYSFSEESNDVVFSVGNAGASYIMEYTNGMLAYSDDTENVTIQRIEGEGNRVLVNGVNSELDGVYTGTGEYTTDDYFTDHFGSGEYMTTDYNGKFTNEQDEVINLYQSTEDTVMVIGTVNGNQQVAVNLTVGETKAVGENYQGTYEVEVSEGALTLKYIVNDSVQYTKTFNRASDLTKEEIINLYL